MSQQPTKPNTRTTTSKWPSSTRAAISFTLDNMGEAADLNRNLWPSSSPIGSHYSVTEVLPKILTLLKKYDVSATYFIETWNLGVYGDFVRNEILGAGHEVAWHAWQHEAWAKIEGGEEERGNFEKSFEGFKVWRELGDGDGKEGKRSGGYRGFRPPGGIINGDRTLKLCREFDLRYLSPAAEKAAVIDVDMGETQEEQKLVILPFKWATVDAYYYMETFAGLRKMKGEYGNEPQSPITLVQSYIREIDKTIESGGFLSVLFHPFLTDRPERLEALETVLRYLVEKREDGIIWLARCRDVEAYIRENQGVVGTDPEWDTSSWR